MNRSEHLQRCKDRALAYVKEGEISNAIASFQSDMSKHDDTRQHSALPLMALLLFDGKLSTPEQVTKFISGFN